jgi:hypothetical protein
MISRHWAPNACYNAILEQFVSWDIYGVPHTRQCVFSTACQKIRWGKFTKSYYVLQVFLGILDYATDPEVFDILDVKSVPSIIWIDKETPASLDQIELPRKARMKRDKYGQDGEVWRADLIVKFMKDASGIDVGEVRPMQLSKPSCGFILCHSTMISHGVWSHLKSVL